MKIFIIGYYGSDNIGDEVLLHQVIRTLRTFDPEARIRSLSYRTLRTRELHGIDSVSRNRYRDIIRAIKDADLVVGGGGSMLQNVTSNRSLIYYLALIRAARHYGKPVVLLGNGFGPVRGGLYRSLTRRVLNGIQAFVARDTETFEALKTLKVHCPVVEGADLAYLGYDQDQTQRTPARRVVINLRPWQSDDEMIESVATLCRHLEGRNIAVSFLSMQPGKDDGMQRRLEEALGHPIESEPNDLDHFGKANPLPLCLVGMRLHALIWAGLQDVPQIGISYDPKVSAYLAQTGQQDAGSPGILTGDLLIKAFERLEADRGEASERLKRSNRIIHERALQNARILETHLGKESRP